MQSRKNLMVKRLIVAALILFVAGSILGFGFHRYLSRAKDDGDAAAHAQMTGRQHETAPLASGRSGDEGTTNEGQRVPPDDAKGRKSPATKGNSGIDSLEEDVPSIGQDSPQPSPRVPVRPRLDKPQLPKSEDTQPPRREEQPPPRKEESPPPKREEQPRPGREKPPVSQAGKPEPEDRLKGILKALKSQKEEERLRACEGLGNLGETARPAARALCEAALDPSQKVARAALLALEKVHPELQQPVLVLLVDDKPQNHIQAVSKLGLLGERAKPAVPVVLFQIKKGLVQLSSQTVSGHSIVAQVIIHNMEVLPKIAPEDVQVVKALIELAQLNTSHEIWIQRAARSTKTPFRDSAVVLLGNIAEAQPDHRKQIIPALVSVLKEATDGTKATEDYKVLAAVADLSLTGDALLKCGAEAKETLEKEVLPRLKELKFHRSDQVRQAAETLQKKIEGAK